MKINDSKKDYNAPQAGVVEVNIQCILCLSGGGIGDMDIDEDGGDDFE